MQSNMQKQQSGGGAVQHRDPPENNLPITQGKKLTPAPPKK